MKKALQRSLLNAAIALVVTIVAIIIVLILGILGFWLTDEGITLFGLPAALTIAIAILLFAMLVCYKHQLTSLIEFIAVCVVLLLGAYLVRCAILQAAALYVIRLLQTVYSSVPFM